MTVSADVILREAPLNAAYKTEIAWGGNLCRSCNTSGVIVPTASADYSDALYPASNVISGWDVHYNPAVDLDNNWWGSNHALANDLVIDLGASKTINNIQVFLHPFLNTCSNFNILRSTNGSSYTSVQSYTGVSQSAVVDCSFTAVAVRYIKISPQNLGADGWVRIVQVKAFNWTDESNYVRADKDTGKPNIKITAKSDQTQNAIPSPSEATIVLENTTSRFSAFNTSSAIYGITLPDGMSSNIRDNVPVKITASGTDLAGNTFSQVCFSGFIKNDDSPMGAMGIMYDNIGFTATVICKSLYALLNQTISTPVYSGVFFYRIVEDICWRCGIPQQYLNISQIFQMAPYVAFGTGQAAGMINQILEALPFAYAYETFAPLAFNLKNYGRSRMDADLSAFITNIYDQCCDTSGNIYYLDVPTSSFSTFTAKVWRWNPAYSLEDPTNGIKQIASWTKTDAIAGAPAPSIIRFYGSYVYVTCLDTAVYKISMGGSVSSLGKMCGSDTATLKLCEITGQFMFMFMDITLSIPVYHLSLVVWDLAKNFSTKVMVFHNLATNVLSMSGTGTYLVLQAYTQLWVWNHTGNPYGVAWSLGIIGSVVANGGNGWFDPATETFILLQDPGDNYFHVDSYDIAYFIAHGSVTPIDYGATIPSTNMSLYKTCFSGDYVFFVASDSSAWVYNLSTSKLFQLSAAVPIATEFGWIKWVPWSSNYSVNNSMMIVPVTLEGTAYSLFCLTPAASAGGPMTTTGFIFTSINTFDPAPAATFSLSNFLCDAQPTTGNPKANWIRVISALNTAPNTNSNIWDRPKNYAFAFPTGKITTLPISLGGNSIRGTGSSNATKRTLTLSWPGGGSVDLLDDPTTWVNVSAHGITYPFKFFAYGDMGYLTADLRASVPAFVATQSASVNTHMVGKQVIVRASYITYEVKDEVSLVINSGQFQGQYFKEMQSMLLNDPSFASDFLLMGKYSTIFLPALKLPWYPIVYCMEFIEISDVNTGFTALFKVVEYTVDGWETTIKAVQYYPAVYNL